MYTARLWRFCEIQLYVLILALPFEYYLDSKRPLLTTLKIQVAALIVTWICMKGIEFFQSRNEINSGSHCPTSNRLLFAMAMFALVQILTAILAPEFRANALRSAAKTCIGVVLAIVAADLSLRRDSRKKKFSDVKINAIAAVALAGLTMALLGFGDWIGIKSFSRIVTLFEPTKYFLGDSVRFVSTMEYPNTAASFLSVSLCATLALIISRVSVRHRDPWRKTLVLIPILILGAAISLTYSRGALAATIVAVAVATWVWRDQFRFEYSWVASGLCLAVLFAGAWPSYLVRHAAESFIPPAQKRNAHYGWNANAPTKHLSPGKIYDEDIAVQNSSPDSWRSNVFGLAYRWYSLKDSQNSPLQVATEFHTDILPTQRVRVRVSFKTPMEEGEYLLIWFVIDRRDQIHEVKDSYSPGIMCVVSAGMAKPAESFSPKAQRYLGAISEERRALSKALIPQRWELWAAALRMFWSRPLVGLGPDSFRLRKQEFMEVPGGDETILANNLYLELLSESGILGLLSFLWVIWELGRRIFSRRFRIEASGNLTVGYFGVAYLTVWMAHGMVDYFFKFTPTFVLFWLILGLLNFRPNANGIPLCE